MSIKSDRVLVNSAQIRIDGEYYSGSICLKTVNISTIVIILNLPWFILMQNSLIYGGACYL